MAITESPPEVEAPWRIGLRAARANVIPGTLLQLGALGLVLAYYQHPPTRAILGELSAFRARTGYAFSAISTPLFGGLLPFLYLRANPRTRYQHPWSHLLFYLAFWSWKGVEVDAFYRLLAATIGPGNDVRTVGLKVIVDQFVYNLLWAGPASVVAFAWRDAGYRWAPVARQMREAGWYPHRVLPTLVSTWGVWVPAVVLIYALPSGLQVPLFNLVICFWTLLLSHVLSPSHPSELAR